MLSDDERNEIINLAVERTLLLLPETVGNLIANHMAMSKLNSEFYAAHPEFRDKKDVVVAVVEMIEGENPLEDYEGLLRKAVPKIRERIETMKTMPVDSVEAHPSRDFKDLEIIRGDTGPANGEL